MAKNWLTILGCSGSVMLTLATGQKAQANPIIREFVFTATDTPETVAEASTDCGCTMNNLMADDILEDRVGDEAIALYGCDCAGCRFIVREQMTANQSSEFPNLQ